MDSNNHFDKKEETKVREKFKDNTCTDVLAPKK